MPVADTRLRCAKCGAKLAEALNGAVVIRCPKSSCRVVTILNAVVTGTVVSTASKSA